MAEIETKKHVSSTGQSESLPPPIARHVNAEISRIPKFQSAYNNYGEQTNWMSSIGSSIASKASNEIATKLGGDLGKNPQGNLAPSLTNFDKQLQQSYVTQAQSTIGIEAQKLITKSNLELTQAERLDPDMIAKSQQSTLQGLDKIFSMAPSSIRPQLEEHYSSVMINQNEHLINKM